MQYKIMIHFYLLFHLLHMIIIIFTGKKINITSSFFYSLKKFLIEKVSIFSLKIFFSRGNSSDGYISKDWSSHYGFPMQDTIFDAIPIKEYYHPEYHYETFPNEISTQISIQGYLFIYYIYNIYYFVIIIFVNEYL